MAAKLSPRGSLAFESADGRVKVYELDDGTSYTAIGPSSHAWLGKKFAALLVAGYDRLPQTRGPITFLSGKAGENVLLVPEEEISLYERTSVAHKRLEKEQLYQLLTEAARSHLDAVQSELGFVI